MGKSLNMNTLYTFLDYTQNTKNLFDNLYISKSPAFVHVNRHPAIFLNFKDYGIEVFRQCLRDDIVEFIGRNLELSQYSEAISRYIEDKKDFSAIILREVSKVIYNVTGKKLWILIDEYDKPIFDNIYHESLDDLKKYITAFLSAGCKSNRYLNKAVLTGVTRIARENMFSGLNNVETYDVLRASVYDNDFSLTDEELRELIQPECPEDYFKTVQRWYNNMTVGDARLYNIYSVMSFLKQKRFLCFWGYTGGTDLLESLLNPERTNAIQYLLAYNIPAEVSLKEYISLKELASKQCTDDAFYSLAVQAGYLSFEKKIIAERIYYSVYIPNEEARQIWKDVLANSVFRDDIIKMNEVFRYIHEPQKFEQLLGEMLSDKLSFHDIGGSVDEREDAYHVYVLGLLDRSYQCLSNREQGDGRPDIIFTAPKFHAIIEFKTWGKYGSAEKAAENALKQINEHRYYAQLSKDRPIYKIGIGFRGKKCAVKAELHIVN
jgi:hypothetical protein